MHFVPQAIAEPSGVKRASHTTQITGPPVKNDRALPELSGPTRKSQGESMALPPRGSSRDEADDKPNDGRAFKPAAGSLTGLASLAVVLGLFLAAAWAVRRGLPAGPAKLPSEAVEVLGRTPLAGRQFAHLIRCGNKLLLIHLAPGCAETLTEITDPVEVDRLAGLCRQMHPQSATMSFRQVFQQWGKKHD